MIIIILAKYMVKPWTSGGFFYSVQNFYHRKFIQPHDDWITNPATRWLHHTVRFFFFTTITLQDLVYGQSSSHWQRLRVSSSRGFFPFLPRTIPTSTDQQGGISFHTTHMGKITHTHSPRTGVESSTTYLRVRICAYSPRTGIRSECLQNPWGVTLTMEPNHLRPFQMQWVFSFLPRPTDKYLRVLQ